MSAIGWILRLLAIILDIRLLMRCVGGLLDGLKGGTTAGESRSAPKPRVGGRLVKDPQCGMHIPEAGALRLGTGDNAVYFCSASCRDQWSAARRAG